MTRKTLVRGSVYLLVLLLAVGGTWWAASRFVSQRQREAAASAPPPSDVLVEVVRGDLSDTSSYVGKVQASSASHVQLPTPKDGTVVVTATPLGAGATIEDTSPVIYLNGRPIIAFHGAFPLYRDLREGDSGPDVSMIQQALVDARYPVNVSGSFDSLTAGAIIDIYQRIGLRAPMTATPTNEDATSKGSVDSTESPTVVTLLKSEALIFSPDITTLASVPPVGATGGETPLALEVNGSGMTVTATVDAAQGARLSVGMCGEIHTPSLSIPTCITSIAPVEKSGMDDKANQGTTTRLSVLHSVSTTDAETLKELREVSIDINLSDPLSDVLLVPQAALIQYDGTHTSILVKGENGLVSLSIDSSTCIGGLCAVTSSDPQLVEGARVKVDNE